MFDVSTAQCERYFFDVCWLKINYYFRATNALIGGCFGGDCVGDDCSGGDGLSGDSVLVMIVVALIVLVPTTLVVIVLLVLVVVVIVFGGDCFCHGSFHDDRRLMFLW